MKNFTILCLTFLLSSTRALAAPVQNTDDRSGKALTYFDYAQPEETEYQNYLQDSQDYSNLDYEENELSRTVPSRKRIPSKPYNSPIYYIRLPPQPYMFVPGMGYVSQQTHSTASQFLNLPVSFLSNGKPGTIYQWNGSMGQFPSEAQPLPPVPPPMVPAAPNPQPPQPKPADSVIRRLPGKYVFNGKPNDIFVLGDSLNSIYGDALQNFYP